MFQLRLGMTVLLILLTGAAALVAGTNSLTEQILAPFDTVAMQAQKAVTGQLARHGAEVVDAAAKAAVDGNVRASFKKGELVPEAEAALLAPAGSQGAPSFALLVKPDGTIAARAGADVKLEANLAGLPIVAEAKSGIARDGLMNADGVFHHVAAAPAYEGAEMIGVALLGWSYDASFAEAIKRTTNAEIALLAGGTALGPIPNKLTVEDLKQRGAPFGAPDLGDLPALLPLMVPEKGRFGALGIPVFPGDNALEIVVVTDRNPALKAIATAQGLVIVGTLGLALLQLIITLSIMAAVRKPIDLIMDHLAQFQQGGNVGILPEANLSGQFLRLGKQVNMILQMTPSASRPGAPLGSLTGGLSGGLSGSMPPMSGGMLGGAPQNGAGDTTLDGGTPPRASVGPGSTGADLRLPAVTPNPTMPSGGNPGGLAGLFDDGPDPLAAFRVKPGSGPSASAPSSPSSPPALPPEMEGALPANIQPEATVMFQVPQELIQQSAEPARQAHAAQVSPMSAPQRQVDDARTVVAQIPQELLSQVTPKGDVAAQDEAHYREVYDKFVETRISCGEDTSDLTYERFVAKLLKNRQQIVEKHKAKSVRFQVYVKEGKAALRALPVREP